jgi:hypothetical protein
MRAKAVLWIIGLGLVGSGCSIVSTATVVVSSRVKETMSDCLERRRNRAWAEAAWQDVLRGCGREDISEDYANGFRQGFAEHLYRGTVQPPPLPPPHYRRIRYQTPAGYQAIEAWFAGFKHGISVAQAGRYRDFVTGPSSLRMPFVSPAHAPIVPAGPVVESEEHGEEAAPAPGGKP